MSGEDPAYLTQLLAEVAPEPKGKAAELRKKLRGDCHGHSDWSDGGSPIRTMAEAARDIGHEYWTLTDHSARLTVAHGLDADRLRAQLEEVAKLNEELAPFRILTGIEVDILEDGTLDQDEDLLASLDVVVASVHSKLRMESAPMTRRMLAAIENPEHRHPRSLHRSDGGRTGTARVDFRPQSRHCRLRRHGHGCRDQLTPRTARSAACDPESRSGRRLHDRDRHLTRMHLVNWNGS